MHEFEIICTWGCGACERDTSLSLSLSVKKLVIYFCFSDSTIYLSIHFNRYFSNIRNLEKICCQKMIDNM